MIVAYLFYVIFIFIFFEFVIVTMYLFILKEYKCNFIKNGANTEN